MGATRVKTSGKSHFGEQRGADLLLLLWPCTESETPWTGRSEICPTVHIFALFCIKYLQAQMNLC